MKADERLKLILVSGGVLFCLLYFFVHLPLQERCRENEAQALQLREEYIAVQNFQNAHLNLTEYQTELAQRLERADTDRRIQGYADGVFWARNSRPEDA